MRLRALLLGIVALAACSQGATASSTSSTSSTSSSSGSPAPPTSPPFDAAWRISTHNSYWVDRGVMGDLFASGTQERLADQLLVDHARGVEIDIHKDATPHAFAVFHTAPGNVLCGTLPDCLAELRAFHYAMPDHEAVHVTLELKEITASIFDATHTIEDLDRVLETELGPLLYRPADFMARCPGATTLSACAKSAGWPASHDLRGRFLVAPMGNWDGIGAQATKDYIDYATHGDIRDRAGFPMASSWQLDHEALNGTIYNLVTQSEIDAAYAESIFMQVEDTADPNMSPFLARHGIVRLDNAVTADDQKARAALGAQLLQTDSPWVQADDAGPSQPFRSLVSGFGRAVMTEPGGRLALGPAAPGERVFAYALETSASTAWETTVSSGADATRVGCLRAASAASGDDASLTVCRTKIPASRGAMPGTSDGGAPDAEQVVLHLTVCQAGACSDTEVSSSDPMPSGPGDLLRMEITNAGDGGSSCVRVRSTARAGTDLVPTWTDVGTPSCFTTPLVYQGIATPSSSWFFGTRRERGAVASEVRGADFTGVVAESAGAVDGGVGDAGEADDGGVQDAGALLVDDSAP